MVLQTSGPISFDNIRTEFGTGNNTLGQYRVSQSLGSSAGADFQNMRLDTDIPQSGSISFNDFYGKKLNIVVDYYSGGNETGVNARSQYDAHNCTVIGGFHGRPSSTSGKKVIIHVNKMLGSHEQYQNENSKCSLRTGGWNGETDLIIDVGEEGKIFGHGGRGGNGGPAHEQPGQPGKRGGSSLGIEYGTSSERTEVHVRSGGMIVCGYGGGGGGGGAHQGDRNERNAGGGGGGGGAGYPVGENGNGGGHAGAQNGADGSIPAGGEQGGGGGHHGNNDNEARGGMGGRGGDQENAPQNGGAGIHGQQRGGGGAAGISGSAVRVSSSNIQWQWRGNSQPSGVFGATSGETGVDT